MIIQTPQQAINKAFRRQSVGKTELENFKKHLSKLLEQLNDETEEHQKNNFNSFLNDSFYKDSYFINSKGNIDAVIHAGSKAKDDVNVIIEHKKPSNKNEMCSKDDINKKALQEAIYYFMQERFTSDGKDRNTSLKQILITNNIDVLIFDANVIENVFVKNKKFKKDFVEFESKQKSGTNTGFFYDSIARPFIEEHKKEIEFTYVNLLDYQKYLDQTDYDEKLINLYKLFSPTHLLKLNFSNDSNSLDRNFYSELLHIIGLEEVKDGGKKVIKRCKEPHLASILENTMDKLEGKFRKVENYKSFGETDEERLFAISLELVITWINRILFLKLLESQLIAYNRSSEYKFIDNNKIKDYDDLETLFFKVLAVREKDRKPEIQKDYDKIPYLNSSLFEPNELEYSAIEISNLNNKYKIPIHSKTVLKDSDGKKLSGEIETLEYLLKFLDSYNFSSEGTAQVQEDNKTLINASVLGLIYEKLNGYKDGSYFSPGYITMYMCRETIRRAVVQKFNDELKLDGNDTFEDFENLKIYTHRHYKSEEIQKFNEIINSLHICDPAVGSGHFLVSALNEIIAIKYELGILVDKTNTPLQIELTIENDELIIEDKYHNIFSYDPQSSESQKIQETIFHEKQTIIENCLFGVDINPNSVKICRLRLWIELLKNTYYNAEGYLEVLPNIDINIKCGNSLISRFDIDTPIDEALKKSKWNVESYRNAVYNYKNSKNKEEKEELVKLIDEIKSDFESEVATNDKRVIKLNKLRGELLTLTTQQTMFDMSKVEKKKWEKDVKNKTDAINKLEQELEEIKNNKIYDNAFEWRFEFPEVLADNGDFVGFDVVIGNPPYLRPRNLDKISSTIFKSYRVYENQFDLYHLFIERSYQISKNSRLSLIVPNSFLGNTNTLNLRKFILDNLTFEQIIDSRQKVFEEADVDVLIMITGTKKDQYFELINDTFNYKNEFDSASFKSNLNLNFTVTLSKYSQFIFNKLQSNHYLAKDCFDICSGIKEYQVGKGKPKQTAEDKDNRIFNSNYRIDDTYRKELRGKNINRYSINWNNEFIKYGDWIAEPRQPQYFEGERLLIRQIPGACNLVLSYTNEDYIIDQTLYVAKPMTDKIDLKFALGFFNTKIIYWYFSNLYNEFDNLFPKIKTNEFKELPIPKLSRTKQQPIINLVDQILEAKKDNPEADTSKLEAEIDQLVYKLYDLTEEEIAIVEGVG